jgi:hypothetical protein
MPAKNDIDIAQYLAREGYAFSVSLTNDNRQFFNTLPYTYYAIASAIALCWTNHAQFEKGFIEYASGFIDGKIAKDPSIAKTYCFRFGEASLDGALSNYRLFYSQIKKFMPDFQTCSMQEINSLQVKLLSQLDTLRNKKTITGIGIWLFLGPFKIILGDQERFWDNEGINSIVLPLGIEVNRGINRLIQENYGFMVDFDTHWLEEDTGSLLGGYATSSMAQTHLSKIAAIAKTSVLHINSGLWKYGKREI